MNIFRAAAFPFSFSFLLLGSSLLAQELDFFIDQSKILSWPTSEGRTYQLQTATSEQGPWSNLGVALIGDGTENELQVFQDGRSSFFRVLETIPGTPDLPPNPQNGGFEAGTETTANLWSTGASQPPFRTNEDARSGNYAIKSSLLNSGTATSEGLISQFVVASGGTLQTGEELEFSFWVKEIRTGPSYLQQYSVTWFDEDGNDLGGTGLRSFPSTIDTWVRVSETLTTPSNAAEALVRFRFVTGAVSNDFGEVLIDDVALGDLVEGTPEVINFLTPSQVAGFSLQWNSSLNIPYQAFASTDLENWASFQSQIIGDGGPQSLFVTPQHSQEFFRLGFPSFSDPLEGSGITPLFNASTALEPATTVETPTALITYTADRARDRHAREGNFAAYDHYLPWYWQERSLTLEIIDEVPMGGDTITFNYTTQGTLGAAEFRAFFRGIGTVAEYHSNMIATLVGPNQYQAILNQQQPEFRPLKVGDRIELEISQFLQDPANGRSNYYGTTVLYIVGQGIVPWEGITLPGGPPLDSFPLPESAWLGGLTTLPYQYSEEPEHRFKQMAGNIAPISAQPFLLGRRLHHTNFDDGSHTELGNPIFAEQIGKLGNKFTNRSCVACHTGNGRALPPAIGAPMLQSVVRVGSDASGTPHPTLGYILQPQSNTGSPEGSASIAEYTTLSGQYGDGTPYTLRKPVYQFSGETPSHFSVRLAPQLVGLGLLEAIDEAAILALADPDDSNSDGISGRAQTVLDTQSAQTRLGRFSYKASQPKLIDQVANALNGDMGVTTSLAPILDGETDPTPPEVSESDLALMNRYISLLAVGARRDLDDSQALLGEQIFSAVGCAACHTPTFLTSSFSPITELRAQTIHPFTDLLLHDMGPGLADTMGEANASGAEWRTPPLWNIGLTAGVSGGEAYLHDGRARSLEEAILWHSGEGENAKENFRTLPAAERDALITFLRSL